MIDEDEVGLKENPEEILHQIRPETPGVQANELGPNFAIIETADSGKCSICASRLKVFIVIAGV